MNKDKVFEAEGKAYDYPKLRTQFFLIVEFSGARNQNSRMLEMLGKEEL